MTGRRQRKKKLQVERLLDAFSRNPNKWTIEESIEIGENLGLDRIQVSKWNWDHRRKLNLDTTRRTGQIKKSFPPNNLLTSELKRVKLAIGKFKDF